MAMQNVFNILVDLKVAKSIPQPLVTQNDSVVFILEVMENGVPFDLTGTTTVSLAHTRKDKTVVVTQGTKDGNKATFTLGTNETSVPGSVTAKAQFYDANGRISTLSFSYQVGQDPTGSGYIPSVVEQTLIQVVMNNAQQKIDELSQVDVVNLASEVAETVSTISMPEKYGIKTKSPKLVITGATNDELKIVQYNGVKYVVYTLDKAAGDSSANSVAGTWDLIRLKKAIMANNAYVAKKDYDAAATVGTINTLYAPAFRNTLEDYLIYSNADEATASFLSTTGDGFGLSVNGIVGASAISSVSWNVKLGTGRKCNILVFGTTTASTSADILVNGEVVKSFDSTKVAIGTNLTFKIIEFEIPSRVNIALPFTVTLRNNDTANKKLYFSCLNFMLLKDYDGRDIDFYKVFTTSQKWIDHSGANDYAIFDHDLQKWAGSYHGGETRLSAKMTYGAGTTWNPVADWDTGRFLLRNKTDVPVGWAVMPSFKLQQLTNINNKGKMLSILDFDVDGTLQMDFSFFDGTINAETFYTALTNSHIDFNYIRYPRYEALPAPPNNVYLKSKEGYLIQFNSIKGISLGIRHTLFGGRYSPQLKKSGWIYNHDTFYKKHYYGFLQEYTQGVIVDTLQFRKALDFMSE